MTTPVLTVHCRRMPPIGGYHMYGLASILTGLESNRACVGYAWPTNCSPSTPSHLSTGTSKMILNPPADPQIEALVRQLELENEDVTLSFETRPRFPPDGHGYELVSSVRALLPQKFSVEKELMHVKHVEVKSPPVGVMWKFGRGVISSAEFTPRLSASSVNRLANQRLQLGRDEVSDWLDARPSTFVRLGVNEHSYMNCLGTQTQVAIFIINNFKYSFY
ncbi:nibrin [Trichonephila clavipes]|nr:nibrin [Trichonephila clavipes]